MPLLNYVHAFEDFNRRFFAKTELNKAEIDSFHRELSQIIDDYFSATSRSRIPVKNKINQGDTFNLFKLPSRKSEFQTKIIFRIKNDLI